MTHLHCLHLAILAVDPGGVQQLVGVLCPYNRMVAEQDRLLPAGWCDGSKKASPATIMNKVVIFKTVWMAVSGSAECHDRESAANTDSSLGQRLRQPIRDCRMQCSAVYTDFPIGCGQMQNPNSVSVLLPHQA